MTPQATRRTPIDRQPRPDQRGVSLLAMLLSLCVVAVVAVVAIPSFFARHEVTLDNACKLLLKDVRSTQNRSAFLKTTGVLRVHGDGWEAVTEDGAPLSKHGATDKIERVLSVDGVFEGVTIENIDFGGDGELAFSPQGLALEGGRLEIAFRGERRLVTIEKGTGLALATTEDGQIVAGDAFALDVSKP